MPQKGQLHHDEAEGYMDCQEEFERDGKIMSNQVYYGKLQQRNKKGPVRLCLIDYRLDDSSQKHVDYRSYRQHNFLHNPFYRCISRRYLQIINQRLQSLNFIVDQSICIGMMTQHMTSLPLLMRKTSERIQKAERMIFHVDEVMCDSDYGIDECSTENSEEIGFQICHGQERKDEEENKDGTISHRLRVVLQLLRFILFQDKFFDFSVQTFRLECKSRLLFDFSFTYIISLKNGSCFILIEMVGNEMFRYILSFCVSQPVTAARMRLNVGAQIIEFVLYDPKLLLVLPQINISRCLLFGPYDSRVVKATRGQRLFSFRYIFLLTHLFINQTKANQLNYTIDGIKNQLKNNPQSMV